MAGLVLLLRSIRPCESMHGNARKFLEQVSTSIIYDSRCGMRDVTFRTAPPIGWPSCLFVAVDADVECSQFDTVDMCGYKDMSFGPEHWFSVPGQSV